MNDEQFLDSLRARVDDAHTAAPGAGSPPPGLWEGILAEHDEGRTKTMNAMMSSDVLTLPDVPRSRRTIYLVERSRKSPRLGYAAAVAILTLALLGGMFVANERGPGGGDRGDLRYAAQPVSQEASPVAAAACDVEPLTEDEVIEMGKDPEGWIRRESGGNVTESPWPVDGNSTLGTMIFAQPGIGRTPNSEEFAEMQVVVDQYLGCWSSGSMPQIWALMDPHRIGDQVRQGGEPMYSDDEIDFRVGQMMDNPARWIIPDPSFEPGQVMVQATADPERARIHEMQSVTIGYVGTDTFDVAGNLIQTSDWLDRRSVAHDEHDLAQSSFGTVTLLRYPGIDRWFVHDVIVGEVDWSGLEALTPVASPVAVMHDEDA